MGIADAQKLMVGNGGQRSQTRKVEMSELTFPYTEAWC
jgi:hypothetical protein